MFVMTGGIGLANHARDNGQDGAQLGEHASRASALLASRAQAVKDAAAKPSVKGADAKPGMRGAAASRPGADAGREPAQAYPKGIVEFVRQNAVYIAGVAAVALVVALGLVVLGALAPDTSDFGQDAEGEPDYVSPYDWTKLDRSNGRYRYIVDGEVKSRLGVDVSENQHDIDWEAVAADGIDFAMIRLGYRGATEGGLYLDGQYRANMDGARNAGLDVGVYFFSQARTVDEAVEEADFVLGYLDGVSLQYPIAFDSEKSVPGLDESRTTGLGVDEMTAIAEVFCARVKAAGYRPVVYGNAADLSRYRYGNLEQNPIWWAEYGMPVPAAKIDIDYWQYSNGGEVAGIPVAVDMNIDLTHALD